MNNRSPKERPMRKIAAALVVATSFLGAVAVVAGQFLPTYFPYN